MKAESLFYACSIHGCVCAGTSYGYGGVATMLGLEVISSSSQRLQFTAASIAYLTEQLSLDVSVVGASASGTTFRMALVSTHATNSSLLSPWTSLKHIFEVSFGDGSATQTFSTTSFTVSSLSSFSSTSSAEVEVTYCFPSVSNYSVAVQAVSPFGNAVVWSGQVASTACTPSPSPSPGFSGASRIAPLAFWASFF